MTREEDLIDAILLHDNERIDGLLKLKEVNVNYCQGGLGDGGSSILTIAAGQGQVETVRRLIKRGANVNCNNHDSAMTPLQAAVRFGSKVIVELLLENGADTRVPCAFPYSLLIEAAWRGRVSIAEILIARGADIYFRNKYSKTALSEAFEYGHPKLILLLSGLQKKCEVPYPEEYYQAVLELLRGKPDNVNRKFVYYGNTKLSFLTYAVQMGHWKIARILHSKGAKHYSDDNEMTLLHYSVLKNSVDTARFVLSLPEYQTALNRFTTPTIGSTPLGLVCEQGFDHTARLLIENGAALELRNSCGESPLSKAYKHPRTKTVQLLLDLGANPDLIKPYSRIMDPFHIDFYEKCFIVQNCLDERTLKLLASYIQVEYYKNTKDCLLSKHEKLLALLIDKFAKHAGDLILQKNIAAVTKRLLEMIDESRRTFDNDQAKIEFMQKQLIACKDMIAQSLINRLTTLLCKPPGYFMQSYCNYHLQPEATSNKPSIPEDIFFFHVNGCLGETGLELFGTRLSAYDCSLHFRYLKNPVEAISPITASTNSASAETVRSLVSRNQGDVKETKEDFEIFFDGIMNFYNELHETRLELSNRIMQKYRSRALALSTPSNSTPSSVSLSSTSFDVKSLAEAERNQMTQISHMSLVPVQGSLQQRTNLVELDTKHQRETTSLLFSDSSLSNVISLDTSYQNVGQIMAQVFHLLETEQDNEHHNTVHSLVRQVSQSVSQATLLKTAQLLLEKIYIIKTPNTPATREDSTANPIPRLLTPQLDLQQNRNREISSASNIAPHRFMKQRDI